MWEWDGSVNNRWNNAGNWTGPAGIPNAVNATATLGSIVTANTTIGLRGNRTVGTLNFTGSQNFTIFNGSGGTRTLNMNVSSGNASINIDGSNSSTLASTVRLRLNDNLVIDHTGSGVFTVAGQITQGGGTRSITVDGTGITVFQGANSYAGTTTINGGTLQIENNTALGTTAAGTVVNSGGTLALAGGLTIANETLTLSGTGSSGAGALRNVSGNNTYDANISLGAAATITSASAGQTLTIGAAAADRSFNNNGFTLTVDGAGNTLFNSQFSGSGGLIKNGTGTTTLFYGQNSDPSLSVYTGATTVNEGLLITDLGATDTTPLTPLTGPITIGGSGKTAELSTQWFDNIGNSTQVTVLDQGTLTINNSFYNSVGFTETIGDLNLAGGSLVRTIDGVSNDAVLQLSGDVTHSGAGTTSAIIQGNLSLGGGPPTQFAIADSAAAVDLDVRAEVSNGGILKTGAGTMALTGAVSNTYTGATTVSGGVLELAKSGGATAIAGTSVTVNSGGTLMLGAADQINDAASLTLAGSVGNEAVFSTGSGFSETLGTLTLSGDSEISLGSAVHLLQFADSSSIAWTGNLTIFGWVGMPLTSGTAGQIFFGNNASTLTSSQLASISFDGFGTGSILLTSGELVPVAIPEWPAISIAILLLALFLGRDVMARSSWLSSSQAPASLFSDRSLR